ncbi:MAG: hypothetical protein GY847_38685 [Proteobacteria bacterium]|nr:hypothetical protein [Pseudomonadota bacterium]
MENSRKGDSIPISVTVGHEPLHPLPRTQYGHFIEHLGKCIKGGIWAENESEGMFLGGVRPELVEQMRAVNPSVIRYPGGCFADGYHWKDGIGPRDKRPRRWNRAWGKLGLMTGPIEDNHFGTDEFLRLCEELGAEPQITANVGSGTAAEAADWVEYVNGPSGSGWGAERAKNGHPEPYRVKYWFLGNEIFGIHEIGHQNPQTYAKTVRQYAEAMRRVDRAIKIVACGTFMPTRKREHIHSTVLGLAGDVIDYLSIHFYATNPIFPSSFLNYQILGRHKRRSTKVYYDVMASLRAQETYLSNCIEDVHKYAPAGKKIGLSFDEFNTWYSFYSDLVAANQNLRDALWVASSLNMFHRLAPDLPLTNISQMVNVVGIIVSSHRATFSTPSALVYRIYTENAGDELLRSDVDGPSLPHKIEVPALDVSATLGGDKLSVFLVNRHLDAEVVTNFSIDGFKVEPSAERIELHHNDAFKYNTNKEPEAVTIDRKPENLAVTVKDGSSCFPLRVPPHSLTCLALNVTRPLRPHKR